MPILISPEPSTQLTMRQKIRTIELDGKTVKLQIVSTIAIALLT
jgi:hypothetical protein